MKQVHVFTENMTRKYGTQELMTQKLRFPKTYYMKFIQRNMMLWYCSNRVDIQMKRLCKFEQEFLNITVRNCHTKMLLQQSRFSCVSVLKRRDEMGLGDSEWIMMFSYARDGSQINYGDVG